MMSSIAPRMAGHAASINPAHSTAEHLKISKAAARTLDIHSLQAERLLARLTEVSNLLAEGLREWSKWIQASGAKNPEAASFITALRMLVDSMQSSNKQIQSYIDSVNSVRGTSRSLNASAERHIRCMQ